MNRRAIDIDCPDCRSRVLAGTDSDRTGIDAVVDNYPLTRTGELLAVIAGRRVYEHDRDGRLHRRDRYRLRTATTGTILASHTCHHPIPDSWRLPPAPDTRRPQPSQEPPF